MAKKRFSLVFIILLFWSIPSSAQFNIRDSLVRQIESEIGVRELTGNNDGERVQDYLKSSGLSGNYPWCAAFIYWNYLRVGVTLDLKYPAYVPSYFTQESIIYRRGKGFEKDPLPGDLIGIYFKSKKRLAHIGFYYSENGKYYITIEGNTNKKGSREGDGVYKKYRPKATIHSMSSFIKKQEDEQVRFPCVFIHKKSQRACYWNFMDYNCDSCYFIKFERR